MRTDCRWGAASDVGKERTENEDAFHIEPDIDLFLVSDGMGGHQGGALASKIIVEDLPVKIETRLRRRKSRKPRTIRSVLRRAVAEQSRQVRMEGVSEAGYKGMGATVVLALLQAGRAYIANLGDSRAYRFRRGRFVQISKDHSVVSDLVEKGVLDETEADTHEAQGQITHYAGMDKKAQAHLRTFELQAGDRLLLCTDGLTDMIGHKEIANILNNQPDPQAACNHLIAAANAAGGHDNITTLIIDWSGKK